MATFKLTLEYDGSDFQGWQVQPAGRRTVQGVLEDAILHVTGERVRVMAAGRTDAGVHAEGQVASLRVDTRFDAPGLGRALNAVLPVDVAVVRAEAAADDFDARRDARSKRYRYAIWNGAARSPLRRARCLGHGTPLDLDAVREAAQALVGTHDFASFQAAGSSVDSTVRTLFALEVRGESRGDVELWFDGEGFLRHMVRNLVGTLLEVGRGRRRATSLPALLAARDRRRAGPTAPAHALTLVEVRYPQRGSAPGLSSGRPDGASKRA